MLRANILYIENFKTYELLIFLIYLKAMRAFIESNFKLLDIDNDGIVGIKEYRYNCITRVAIDDVAPIDKAFETLLNVSISLNKIIQIYFNFHLFIRMMIKNVVVFHWIVTKSSMANFLEIQLIITQQWICLGLYNYINYYCLRCYRVITMTMLS